MKTRHHTHPVWLRELLRHPLKPAAPTGARGYPLAGRATRAGRMISSLRSDEGASVQ